MYRTCIARAALQARRVELVPLVLRAGPAAAVAPRASHGASLGASSLHTNAAHFAAVKKTTSAAGGVMGLGKGKKKVGKLGAMEKKELPVETDPERLVASVCGSNIYTTGEDVQIKEDGEYPAWLWTLRTRAPRLDELDPDTKQYWLRVRAAAMRRNNKLRSMRRF